MVILHQMEMVALQGQKWEKVLEGVKKLLELKEGKLHWKESLGTWLFLALELALLGMGLLG